MDFILRKWQYNDANSIAKYANNLKIASKLRNAFPYPYTLENAKEYVHSCADNDEKTQMCRAIVVNGEVVGSIGVFLGRDIYCKTMELGYWLAEPFWGKGIMTKAVKQICNEAFDKFDIVRIYAEPFANNAGSRKVLENAGFTLEGIMRKGVYKMGETLDYCMYSKIKENGR